MSEKLRAHHMARPAFVYVRQSTLHQVHQHLESKRRQYDLKDRAMALGFSEVVVIDDDLGISGTGSRERPGFARLLAAVCAGRVGAVFALEASRLARNNRDWHHLIDLCVLTDTLVVDAEGIYDPRLLNDRLLLGLKGTMSEFELGLLRQRAQEALRQKIQRGEVLTDVPVGFVRTEANGVELTPDRQVQDAIRGVFEQFRRLGSARQVLLWYRQERLPLCRGAHAHGRLEVIWDVPVYHRILAILKNPIYAGAFAYGRTCSRSRVMDGRARKSRGHEVPLKDWAVLIRDHHAGYITWDEFVRNQELLSNNTTKHHGSRRGGVRKGPALLAGLLRCARCGRKLHVGYSGSEGNVPRYQCAGGNRNHGVENCISFGGWRADEAIASVVIEALRPLSIEAALQAWDAAQAQQGVQRNSIALALEKARYEADRTRRQYELVDPANRLVAAELESRWNLALQQVAEVENRLKQLDTVTPAMGEPERQRLMSLAEDLQTVWSHLQAPVELKKRILRTVLEEIVVDVDPTAHQIKFRVHWAGGVHTELSVRKNRTGSHRRATDEEVVALITELAIVCPDPEIASILNRLGRRTGTGKTWTEARVRAIRSYHKIQVCNPDNPRAWMSLADTAKELAVSAGVVRRLIEEKVLPAKQVVPCAPWMIRQEDLALPAVQRRITAIRQGKRAPRSDDLQTALPLITTT